MTDSRQIVRMWFRVLFIALLSFPIVVSLLPIEYTPPTFDIWDKILHVVTYMLVASVGALAFQGPGRWWQLVLGLACLGILLEVGQGFVPGRYPEVADGIANALGAACGVAGFHLMQVCRRKLLIGWRA